MKTIYTALVTLFTLTVIQSTFVVAAFATESKKPSQPSDTVKQSEAVAAQIKVTHETLQQVLAKMRNSTTLSRQFSNPDYLYAARIFNKQAETAMIEFENTLKNDIFPKIEFYLQRLDAIKNAPLTELSDAQKNAMLGNQISIIQIEFRKYNKIYQNALVKLYLTDLPEVNASANASLGRDDLVCDNYTNLQGYTYIKMEFPALKRSYETPVFYVSRNSNPYFKTRFCSYIKSKNDPYPIDIYLLSFQPYGNDYERSSIISNTKSFLHGIVFESTVNKYCWSQGCVSLLSELRKNFVSLVQIELEKDISFYDKTFMLNANPEESLNHNTLLSLLTPTVEDTIHLPFDISDEDFARAQKERIDAEAPKRAEHINSFMSSMIGFDFWGLANWSCPAESIRETKKWLCTRTYLGCMTQEESQNILQTIRNELKDPKEVNERVKCFQEN